jgi:hypothetical protein
MGKLFLSASAYSNPVSKSASLVISVTDQAGAPVLNVQKSWIAASTIAFLPNLVSLSIHDFFKEANGFYSMTLKADPKVRLSSFPVTGFPIAISVRRVIKTVGGGNGVTDEGYITIATSGA